VLTVVDVLDSYDLTQGKIGAIALCLALVLLEKSKIINE